MSTIQSVRPVTVRDKWTGAVIAEPPRATEADIEAAGRGGGPRAQEPVGPA